MVLGGNEKGDLFVCLMLNSVSLEKTHKNDTQLCSLQHSNKDIQLFFVKSEQLNSVL